MSINSFEPVFESANVLTLLQYEQLYKTGTATYPTVVVRTDDPYLTILNDVTDGIRVRELAVNSFGLPLYPDEYSDLLYYQLSELQVPKNLLIEIGLNVSNGIFELSPNSQGIVMCTFSNIQSFEQFIIKFSKLVLDNPEVNDDKWNISMDTRIPLILNMKVLIHILFRIKTLTYYTKKSEILTKSFTQKLSDVQHEYSFNDVNNVQGYDVISDLPTDLRVHIQDELKSYFNLFALNSNDSYFTQIGSLRTYTGPQSFIGPKIEVAFSTDYLTDVEATQTGMNAYVFNASDSRITYVNNYPRNLIISLNVQGNAKDLKSMVANSPVSNNNYEIVEFQSVWLPHLSANGIQIEEMVLESLIPLSSVRDGKSPVNMLYPSTADEELNLTIQFYQPDFISMIFPSYAEIFETVHKGYQTNFFYGFTAIGEPSFNSYLNKIKYRINTDITHIDELCELTSYTTSTIVDGGFVDFDGTSVVEKKLVLRNRDKQSTYLYPIGYVVTLDYVYPSGFDSITSDQLFRSLLKLYQLFEASAHSTYEFPELIRLSDNNSLRLNKITDYILNNLNEHELFLNCSRHLDSGMSLHQRILNLFLSIGSGNLLNEKVNGVKVTKILDNSLPISKAVTLTLPPTDIGNVDMTKYLNGLNKFKEVIDDSKTNSWETFLELYNDSLSDLDLLIEDAEADSSHALSNLINGVEDDFTTSINNVSLNVDDIENIQYYLDTLFTKDSLEYFKNNIYNYCKFTTLSSGILDGVDAGKVKDILKENIRSSIKKITSQYSSLTPISGLFTDLNETIDDQESAFMAFLNSANVGVEQIYVEVDGKQTEIVTKVANTNTLIKQYVQTDLANINNVLNLKSRFSNVKNFSELPDDVEYQNAINEFVNGNISDLYPKQSGLSLLMDETIESLSFMGEKALQWLETNTGKVVMTIGKVASQLVLSAISWIGNAAIKGVSMFLDSESFMTDKSGILDVFSVPIASGTIETPTAFWRDRSLYGTFNVLSMPINTHSRLLLIPDPSFGNKVHYGLYSGFSPSRLPSSGYTIDSISSKLNVDESFSLLTQASINGDKSNIVLSLDEIGYDDLIHEYIDNKIRMRVMLNDDGGIFISKDSDGRLLTINMLWMYGTIEDVKILTDTAYGNTDISDRYDITTKDNRISIDMTTYSISNYLLDFPDSGELFVEFTIRAYNQYINDFDFNISLLNLEVTDSGRFDNYKSTDLDVVESILFSANNAINMFNSMIMQLPSVGDNGLVVSFKTDMNSVQAVKEIFYQLYNSGFKADLSALINTYSYYGHYGTGGSTYSGTFQEGGLSYVATMDSLDETVDSLSDSALNLYVNNLIRSNDLYNLLTTVLNDVTITQTVIDINGIMADTIVDVSAEELIASGIFLLINSGSLKQLSEQLDMSIINPLVNRIDLPSFSSIPKMKYNIKTRSLLLSEAKNNMRKLGTILLIAAVVLVAIKFAKPLLNLATKIRKNARARRRQRNMMQNVVGSATADLLTTDDFMTKFNDLQSLPLDLHSLAKIISSIKQVPVDVVLMDLIQLLTGNVKNPNNKNF